MGWKITTWYSTHGRKAGDTTWPSLLLLVHLFPPPGFHSPGGGDDGNLVGTEEERERKRKAVFSRKAYPLLPLTFCWAFYPGGGDYHCVHCDW